MSLALLALVTPMILASSKPATAPKGVFPYEVQRTTLDNGLEVLMVPMPSEGLVSYWSVVRTGSRDEVEPGVTGFAHFFEHMMFRGSERFSQDVREEIVQAMGADANAFTTDDFTAYHLSFTSEDLPKVIEIEADRFQFLKYDENVFKTESGAVYGEYRKGRTNPFMVLLEALQDKAFDVHTYKHTTIGFEADIDRMDEKFEYSKTFFQRFYRPENVVLLVVGDFDPKSTLAEIRKRYAGWTKGYKAPDIRPEPPQTAQRRLAVPFDGQTLPLLAVSFKGEAYKPDDRTMVAGTLIGELAFGEVSPLYKKLVLDEQRVEALFAGFDDSRDPGLWSVLARVKEPSDVRAVETEIWSAVADLQERPVSAERLAEVASRIKYGFLSNLSTPSEVAHNLAPYIALTGDVACIERMFATLMQVTPEDVQRAARQYLTPERSTVAVLHGRDQAPPPGMDEPNGTAKPLARASGDAVAKDALVLMPVQDPNVSFDLWFKVGSQDDPPGKEGLAELTAAMISEGGTKRLAYEQVLARLFPLATGYGASVDREMTVVRGEVHRDKLDEFLDLLVDAVVAPGFRTEDFERLRDRAVSYLENTLRYSSDEELGKATLYGRIFEGTPYGHLPEGTVASLRSITLDDVVAFHREHYTRDNVVVGLGGGYPEGLPESLRADLGALPAGRPRAVAAPKPGAIEGRQVVLVDKPGPSTAISFGYPIDVHRGSREFYALWIANSWLGEHRNSSSHLYQVIREKRGMNYGDYSYIEAFTSGGSRHMPPTGVGRRQQIFEVWIRPVPRAQAVFALRAALREVEDLAKNGMTREEFETTRRFLKKYSLHFAETTGDRLGYAVDDRFYGVDGHLAKFRKMMDEITLDEVNAAVKKHLRADDLVIAMVSDEAETLAQAIVSGAPSPIDYAGVEKPAELLAEDKEIERYPLRITAEQVTVVPVDRMFAGNAPQEASSSPGGRSR